MFGGRCFMLNGNVLICAMNEGGTLVRTGKDGYTTPLDRPGDRVKDDDTRLD